MIPERYTYLLVDAGCIIVPFLASFHPRIRFYKQWKYFFLPCIVTAGFFIVWDIIFTNIGVWQFNKSYVVGYYFFNLPLEEVLFFIFIPYACSFTYYCCMIFIKLRLNNRFAKWLTILLIVILSLIALTHLYQLYTSVTFLLLSLLLAILLFFKADHLSLFYVSFVLILVPFFISNGILTGSFTKEPVVIYNNIYNLGIRMFTIPVEDTFYGMLLLLMNVTGYMMLKKRSMDINLIQN